MRITRTVARGTARVAAAVIAFVVADVLVAAVRAFAVPAGRVVERGSGRPVSEPRPFGEHARIVLVWTTIVGSRVLCRTPSFLRYLQRASIAYGDEMDEPATPQRIDEFIADYDVDVGDLDRPAHEFTTLNELFSRPLRPGARTVERPDDPRIAVSPADCRLACFHAADGTADLVVKGRRHGVADLVGATFAGSGPGLARVRAFHAAASADGFSVAVCRLAPGDYHRFHWPVDGEWTCDDVLDIAGEYHSVAAPVLAGPVDVLGRNRRRVCVVTTAAFGDVAIVAVGAVRVGTIELTAAPGDAVKGAELGRFRYGGSTVVVVFRRGTIEFDPDLLDNSRHGVETLVRMGSRLGRALPRSG
jgi:phosphatidylserine decarboxylase